MKKAWTLLVLAWLLSVAATAGALFIAEVMGMAPCVLCWYQRIAMFPLAVILGIACYSEDDRGIVYALPFALGGSGTGRLPHAVGGSRHSRCMDSMRTGSFLL